VSKKTFGLHENILLNYIIYKANVYLFAWECLTDMVTDYMTFPEPARIIQNVSFWVSWKQNNNIQVYRTFIFRQTITLNRCHGVHLF